MKKAVKISRFQHFMDYISVTKSFLFNGLRNEISTNQQKKHKKVSYYPPARAGAPFHGIRVYVVAHIRFFNVTPTFVYLKQQILTQKILYINVNYDITININKNLVCY
jgi:hypothetical protein